MEQENFKKKPDSKLEAQTEIFALHGIRPKIEDIEEYKKRVPESEQKINTIEEMVNFKGELYMQKYYDEVENKNSVLKFAREFSEIKDLYNLPETLSQKQKEIIEKYRDEYMQFLRKEKRIATDFFEKNSELYKKRFQSAISEIKDQMKDQENFSDIPEYLDSGSQNDVFKVEAEGIPFAVKIHKNDFAIQVNVALPEIQALIRAHGIPHTSQFVAYSHEDGAYVTTFVPGKTLGNFRQENSFSDKDLIQLLSIFDEFFKRGLEVDLDAEKRGNILFDKETGFYVIDYHEYIQGIHHLPIKKLTELSELLASVEISSKSFKEKVQAVNQQLYTIIESHFPYIKEICGDSFSKLKTTEEIN